MDNSSRNDTKRTEKSIPETGYNDLIIGRILNKMMKLIIN
jgi:hypothetical protein